MTPVHNVTTSGARSGAPPASPPRPPVPLLDLAREYAEVGPEIMAAVEAVFRSQRFVLGPEVAAFEQAAARHCGAAEAIGCGSGTDALWLAMAAAGVQPGDRVLTTAFSFFATASSILRLGGVTVLADIDPRTCNLDPAAASVALEKHPAIRAILPVHLYGQCADWTALAAVKKPENCLLIEDAAQAIGAKWDGVPAGSLGDAAAFSFYPTKNLSAAGEAGMVTTMSAAIARRARSLRTHGMEVRYHHEEVGWNSRLDTVQAAVLLVKLRHLDAWTERRRALAARYDELFAAAGVVEPGPYPEHGVVLPWVDPRAHHVFHQYVIRVSAPGGTARMARRARHRVGGLLPPRAAPAEGAGLPRLSRRRFSGERTRRSRGARVPIFPQLRDDEQERVVIAIRDFFK